MTQFILALCGLPASGKSALADAIRNKMNSDVEIVRTDDWRDDSYYSDWRPEKERPVREAALEKVKELIEQGKSVIHDDTNYYTSMRHELLNVAIKSKCAFAIVHVSTPIGIALKWNNDRNNIRIPDVVIERINERFDPPGRHYLWDDSMIEVDMSKQNAAEAAIKIVEGLRELEPALELPMKMVAGTEFDRLDTETRQIVSEFLEEHPHLRRSRQVSVIRRSVLTQAAKRKMSTRGASELLREKLRELL